MVWHAGHAKVIVVLHPEDDEGAAERKIAAVVGIQALGGGAKVCLATCDCFFLIICIIAQNAKQSGMTVSRLPLPPSYPPTFPPPASQPPILVALTLG